MADDTPDVQSSAEEPEREWDGRFPMVPILCHTCQVPLQAAYGLHWHGGTHWSLYHVQCPKCLMTVPVAFVDVTVPEWAQPPKRTYKRHKKSSKSSTKQGVDKPVE